MLDTNYTTKLLNLQDVEIKNIKKSNDTQFITLRLNRKKVSCPICKSETNKIHDYRTQKVKDLPCFGNKVVLLLQKRRYVCERCGKRFAEPNTFLPKYHRMTKRLILNVTLKLASERSYTSVAKESNLSVSTVIRIFDHVHYTGIRTCPKVIAIDEFKGNTGGQKYNVIITDPETKRVLDILCCRKESFLIDYFKKTDRKGVKFFISDMWQPYRNLSQNFFKNATYIVDKYHWIRQVVWAFERVRKDEQKHISASKRRYFKHSKSLLIKRLNSLTKEQKQAVSNIFNYSEKLSEAYAEKEAFFNAIYNSNKELAKKELMRWANNVCDSDFKSFRDCGKTIFNWQQGILNSLKYDYTNGFTEGCNNKIKVLKRNAYGFRNFERFRNRILHIFAHQNAA